MTEDSYKHPHVLRVTAVEAVGCDWESDTVYSIGAEVVVVVMLLLLMIIVIGEYCSRY